MRKKNCKDFLEDKQMENYEISKGISMKFVIIIDLKCFKNNCFY